MNESRSWSILLMTPFFLFIASPSISVIIIPSKQEYVSVSVPWKSWYILNTLYILLALQCLIAVNRRTFQLCSEWIAHYARGRLTKFIIGSQHLGREVDRLSYCHLSMVKIILANISTQVLWCWGTHFFSVVQYLSFELVGIIASLRKCTSVTVRLSLFFFLFSLANTSDSM